MSNQTWGIVIILGVMKSIQAKVAKVGLQLQIISQMQIDKIFEYISLENIYT